MDWICPSQDPVASFCGHGNEHSGSHNAAILVSCVRRGNNRL